MAAAPTIRSLAKLAGVSAATVSLALRNHPRISPAERARIQRIAADAGYRPNPLMARLTTQLRMSRTAAYQSTLGIVFTATQQDDVEERAVVAWIEACEERASQMGYGFDRFLFFKSAFTPDRLAKILDARNIEGLVVIGPFRGGIIPSKFDVLWRRRAAVVVGESPVHPPLSFVSNDQFSTSLRAMQEVHRLGYRRPGLCIHPDIDDILEKRFLGGYSVAQTSLPLDARLPPCHYDPKGEHTFRHWVEVHRPDVILTLHPEIRLWMKKMGLRAPNDIGLVHLDWTPAMDTWAGIRQNHDQIGFAAVNLVIGQLQRAESGVPPFQKCIVIRGTWVPGPSVRARP